VISSSQRPLPDNTRHSQQTNIHAPRGIRTQDLSRRAALFLNVLLYSLDINTTWHTVLFFYHSGATHQLWPEPSHFWNF